MTVFMVNPYIFASSPPPVEDGPVTFLFQPTNTSGYATDATGKALTYAGNAALSSDAAFSGGASVALDGSGDYVSTPHDDGLDFGSGDFAIEIVAKLSGATEQALVEKFTGSIGPGWTLYRQNDRKPAFFSNAFGVYLVGSVAGTDGAYQHFAVAGGGGSFRLYLDGTQIASGTGTLSASTGNLYLGARNGSGGFLNGNIAACRITKGSNLGFTGSTIPVPSALWPTP